MMKCVTVLVVLLCCIAYADDPEDPCTNLWGRCGSELSFNFYSPTFLHIGGVGRMADYTVRDDPPWTMCREGVTTIQIDDTVTHVGNNAFRHFTSLTTVNLSSSLVTIGSGAFYDCPNLTSITLPSSLQSYPPYPVFLQCPNLAAIHVADGSDDFQERDGVLFADNGTKLVAYPCGKGKKYDIPEDTLVINDYAFEDCANLLSVNIPDGVASIGAYAFDGCSSLTRVNIPASVSSIKAPPFTSCTSLDYIDVDVSNGDYKSLDGLLVSSNETFLIEFPCGKRGSYTIPASIETVGTFSFLGCSGLSSITIPNNVHKIEDRAFMRCENLEVVSWLSASGPTCDEGVFEESSPRYVCVPPSFTSETGSFCGLSKLCKSESCDALQEFENQCFQAICNENEWSSQKRSNASAWEERSNKCVEYQCINTSGRISWSNCNSSANMTRLCDEQYQCIEMEPEIEESLSVTYVFSESVDASEFDVALVVETICELTGLDSDTFTVKAEVDEKGDIVRVIIVTDNEDNANKIADSLNSIKKGTECQYGVFCRSGEAIVVNAETLSKSNRISAALYLIISAAMITMIA